MSAHEKVNILMVDDQPSKLLSYEVILTELGENLIKAGSGREALEHLLKNDIAIVLMDVSMPELDGFELAEIIHQHPRYQKTAIIFISAVHLTDLDRLRGYQHGAVDYIAVPIVPELLRAKVSVFAELYRKTQELERLNRELERRVAERTEELQKRAEALQRLNTELTRRNQELDAFAYVASHDLKEPLRGIANYALFLIEDYAEKLDAEGCSHLVALRRLTERMETLLNSLLHFSRVGREEFSMAEANLDDILARSLELVGARLKETGAEVRVHGPLGRARCNSERVVEVFTNLITNAAKYNDKPQKVIDIGVQRPSTRNGESAGEAVFYVRDNGIGIAEEDVPAIFQIFRRLHTREAYGGGTGTGLTIVKRIIERHGGRLWVESSPNEGSTFFFTFADEAKKNQYSAEQVGRNPEEARWEDENERGAHPQPLVSRLSRLSDY